MWANIPLLSRLITRFKLNVSPQLSQSVYPIQVIDAIMPTTDVDKVLEDQNIQDLIGVLAAGDNIVTAVSVGKRWKLRAIDCERHGAGVPTFAGFGISEPGVSYLTLKTQAAAAQLVSSMEGQEIKMKEGWQLHVACTIGGDAEILVLYDEEDAY